MDTLFLKVTTYWSGMLNKIDQNKENTGRLVRNIHPVTALCNRLESPGLLVTDTWLLVSVYWLLVSDYWLLVTD